ncbi:MAG: hypothetical protein PWQ16_578 [bacterium]|nr:hypothetical protein [bacterium]
MKRVTLVVFSLIIVIAAVLFYLRVESVSQPPKVSTLGIKLENVEEYVEGKAFVFCKSSLVVSPASGKVEWIKGNGDRVRRGSVVAKVGGKVVLAESSGILLHGIDELSGIWNLESVWQEGKLTPFFGESKVIRNGTRVEAGLPIGEIRDNLLIRLVLELKREDFYADWLDKKRISIFFPSFGREEESTLEDVKPVGNKLLLLLSFTGWDDIVKFRTVDVRLVKRKFMGAIIPVNAIIIKEGKSGVYMVRGGRVFFREIKFRELSSALAVTSDLKEGERIVIEPDKVSGGAFIRW